MSDVLTLIASDPMTHPLEEQELLKIGDVSWFEAEKAAHVYLSKPPSKEQIDVWHRHFGERRKTDLFLRDKEAKPIKLLLADMDSTIVAEETLDELAAFAGLKDKVAAITAKAMNGELDFHGAIRERVALLKGLSTSALQETLAATIINPGAKELVGALKKNGATCVLVSGGFTHFTGPIAEQVGFDHHHGNTLGIEGEQLTGEVIEPILDKHAKVQFLDHYCEQLGIGPDEVMTIGDGANDLPMLQKAEFGVGYYAKPSVAAELTNIVQHGDLSTPLYALGLK